MRPIARCAALTVLALVGGCRETPRSEAPAAGGGAAPAATPGPSDELLLAAAKIALPPPGIAAADLPEPSSAGATLLAKYCAQCHDLPAPSMHSATDWPGVVRRMWLRMDRLPQALSVLVPTMAERYTMLEYLTANALKVSGATLPPGKGRDQFALACSRCHALPDPRVHSPEDWPTVFARMERNMERMNVQGLVKAEATEILLYLQTAGTKR